MEDVKTIKAEREVLEQQLKEPKSDISEWCCSIDGSNLPLPL